MKWRAIGIAAAALVLAVGALVFALATRGSSGTPAAVTTGSSPTSLRTTKPIPVPKQPARSVSKPSCQSDTGDPTGSDNPSCGSSDNQAGDSSGDNSGDNQAGDRNSGDSSGDNQAGDRNSGDSSGDNQAGDGKAGGP